MINQIRFYTSDIQGCDLSFYIQKREVKYICFFEVKTRWKTYISYGNKRPKDIEKELDKYSKLLNAEIMPFGSGE